MALGNSTITLSCNASASKAVGGSTLQGKTDLQVILSLIDGSGAGAADDIVDTTITSDNSAVALSTMSTTLGEAVSAQTKIKAILIINNGAASTAISSSIATLPVGTLYGSTSTHTSFLFATAPTAAGWTCTSSSTITSNGTSPQTIRVILFLA